MGDTLYSDATYSRFYLVPEGAGLPKGDLVLRSLTGARLDVDPDVVAAFEIPKEDAQDLFRESLDDALAKGKAFLEGHGVASNDPKAAMAGLASAGTALLDGLRDALASDQVLKDPGLQDLRGKVRDALGDPLLAERIRKATKDIQKAAADLRRERESGKK